MSLPATISRRAEADLNLQYRWYLENANPDVAERFLKAFDATVKRLQRQPALGRRRHFRAAELDGVRSLPIRLRFGNHLIFYRFDADSLQIVRVMHGARDLPTRLLEPSDGPHEVQ